MNIFTIVEGSLKITYNDDVTLLIAKKDLSIISNELYKTVPRAVLFNLNGGYNEKVFDMPLSICSPDGIDPFTLESFIIFAETYLGFSGTGGGGSQNFQQTLTNGNTTDKDFYYFYQAEGAYLKSGVINSPVPSESLFPINGIGFGVGEMSAVAGFQFDPETGAFVIVNKVANSGINDNNIGFLFPNKPNPLYPNKNLYTFATIDDITGGSTPISITKNEIDILISSNSLVAGTVYEITGVHPTLYDDGTNSGTTIYLQALTTNKLASQGNGVFYNPKYNQAVDGFGIWSNRSSWVANLTSHFTQNTLGTTGVSPWGIVKDSLGNIYTSNSGSNNVTKITPLGVSTILGTTGNFPHGIAVDNDGNVYTANSNSQNISKITPAGVSTIFATTGMAGAWEMIIDTTGNLYATMPADGNVIKITPSGVVAILGSTGTNPWGITIDSAGNVYTANASSNNVTKITPAGVSTILGTTGDSPKGITIDQDGNVYTANSGSNNVTKITPAGVSTIFGTTGNQPINIAIDNNGNIFTVAMGAGGTLTKITSGGTATNYTIGSGYMGFIIDDNNNDIYISNFADSEVVKLRDETNLFNPNELITANNGATGQLFSILETNMFIALTGDWSSATSITGDVTGATASVSSVVLQSYTVGSKAIWGGYSWTNLTGDVGTTIDVLNLDTTNWDKDIYIVVSPPLGVINYNRVLDLIEYDIDNDQIVYRRETGGNNTVITSKANNDYLNSQYGLFYNPISVFMWGNVNLFSPYKGISNNICDTGYFECINFQGQYLDANTVKMNGVFYDNIIIGSSYLYTLELQDYGYFNGNAIINSNIYACQLIDYGGVQSNTLLNSEFFSNRLIDNSNINSNTLISSAINSNTLNNSDINENILTGFVSQESNISSNILKNSLINLNQLNSNCGINSNTLTEGYINSNILSGISYIQTNTLSTNSNINLNILNSSSYINLNTLVYSSINWNSLTVSEIPRNFLNGSAIILNIITSSYISANTLNVGNIEINTINNNSTISLNVLFSSSYINSNILDDNSSINLNTLYNASYIETNSINTNSTINTNTLTSSNVKLNELTTSSYIQLNVLNNNSIIELNALINNALMASNILYSAEVAIGVTNILDGKLFRFNTLENVVINVDITGATKVYTDFTKTIYKRPDGVVRLRYYNDNDTLVFANVTD